MPEKAELPEAFREKLDEILRSYSLGVWTGSCASAMNGERRNYTFTSADRSYCIFVLADKDYNILEVRKMVPFDTDEHIAG